eukprot:383236-Prorocentrum_minimum.AAC.2
MDLNSPKFAHPPCRTTDLGADELANILGGEGMECDTWEQKEDAPCKWKCYACDPAPIAHLQEEHMELLARVEEEAQVGTNHRRRARTYP